MFKDYSRDSEILAEKVNHLAEIFNETLDNQNTTALIVARNSGPTDLAMSIENSI